MVYHVAGCAYVVLRYKIATKFRGNPMFENVSADFMVGVMIFTMGFVTYLTRISGFLLIRYVTLSPLIHKVLETSWDNSDCYNCPSCFFWRGRNLTADWSSSFSGLPMVVTLGIGIATVAGLRLALMQMGIENTGHHWQMLTYSLDIKAEMYHIAILVDNRGLLNAFCPFRAPWFHWRSRYNHQKLWFLRK